MNSMPLFGASVVTHTTAVSDRPLQRRVVWEAHEINWRCELLALDALMTGSNGSTELLLWTRESLVSQVWGPGTSGLDVVLSVDENDLPVFCWLAPPEEGWESCRPYLSAFVKLLSRWWVVPVGFAAPMTRSSTAVRPSLVASVVSWTPPSPFTLPLFSASLTAFLFPQCVLYLPPLHEAFIMFSGCLLALIALPC